VDNINKPSQSLKLEAQPLKASISDYIEKEKALSEEETTAQALSDKEVDPPRKLQQKRQISYRQRVMMTHP